MVFPDKILVTQKNIPHLYPKENFARMKILSFNFTPQNPKVTIISCHEKWLKSKIKRADEN